MKILHFFQHVDFEGLGSIANWADQAGYNIITSQLHKGESLPKRDEVDGLILMGGSMSVWEEKKYPWLVEEKKFIQTMISDSKPVLGICFGAQLLAEVLGAKVFPNQHREIGWFPIEMHHNTRQHQWFTDFERQFEVFHWHGDTFDLPTGVNPIGCSEATTNQGFYTNNTVLALQFHLEVRVLDIKNWLSHTNAEALTGKFVQNQAGQLADRAAWKQNNALLDQLLTKFFA